MTSKRPSTSVKRPTNLDLSSIQFPLPALVSIAHRITGVIMFVGLIFVLWAFDTSLSSPEGFASVRDALTGNALAQLIAWGLLSALSYHFVAGIRHLIMDMGYGETLQSGQRGAQLTIIITAVLVVLSGVWVW
ncbi:succinate dehydrogenase, cytochrome b556 subunit [Kushneria phosphatilytica]|uniref:Succinate dehydrogenase cytochrome b556 subunit n=1 Tax=Kushneria phosphatilytica TaxID=657387 RepID=A0A1S1NYA7_9GAMM|nr:succinate dehydrogenase, cytochrome b556 subunit [Kushneria phosphatilytica]OHV12855.1 succinate dehydrogenase, cytochrome b556 subunit [Kushneria phosphatilytica]QEL10709.1 succinate dehydrogenase, cytochrome b556 subunit [Kushneria phosphatilytica]